MSAAASRHLNEDELLELAHGTLEHGSAVHHLDECDECAAAVERLSEREERRFYAELAPERPKPWFSLAARAAQAELNELAANALPRRESSGVSSVVPRRPRTAWRARAAWAAAALASAAGLVLLIHRLTSEPRIGEKSGGVSADAFCARAGEELVPLLPPEGACAVDAQVVVRANAAPDGGLRELTLVACDDAFDCRIVSQARFDGTEAVLAGPRPKAGVRTRLLVVWSAHALDGERVREAGLAARSGGGPPKLGAAQVEFGLHAQ